MLWSSERVLAGHRRTLEQSGGLSRGLRVHFLCWHPSQESGNVQHSPSRWRNLGRARTPKLLDFPEPRNPVDSKKSGGVLLEFWTPCGFLLEISAELFIPEIIIPINTYWTSVWLHFTEHLIRFGSLTQQICRVGVGMKQPWLPCPRSPFQLFTLSGKCCLSSLWIHFLGTYSPAATISVFFPDPLRPKHSRPPTTTNGLISIAHPPPLRRLGPVNTCQVLRQWK